MSKLLYLLFPYLAVLVSLALSQGQYDDALLAVKRRFAMMEIKALAEPFKGIATSQGITPGLFPIRSTGVSTEPIRKAAESFLGALTPEQKIRTVFAVDDPEWRRWCNVDNGIYVRQGVSFEQMNTGQQQAAWDLLRVSLSPRGFTLSRDIMKTDQTLRKPLGFPLPSGLLLKVRDLSPGNQFDVVLLQQVAKLSTS